jgi:UDP-glucose 4-epimerase
MEPRRPGDPSRLIANANKAESILGWKPERAELESIIETAWNARYPRD